MEGQLLENNGKPLVWSVMMKLHKDRKMPDYMKMFQEKIEQDYAKSSVKECYPSYETELILIPMRDGTKLKTKLYWPVSADSRKEDKPMPVIMERTCYPHNERISRVHGENLAKRGYLFLSQYCRGTGGSEGEWEPNVNERRDGLDTLNWLNEQSWVESIGYWGNSYLALTGWAVADQVPDKVKGMCLTHYGTDRFTSAYEKGMFRQDVLTSWAMGNAGFSISADYLESCKYMPHYEVDEKLWGRKLPWYREWISNPKREDSYWQQGWWKELYDNTSKVKVPLYIRSGWYDHHHGSAMRTWDQLPEETKEHSWLDIGGWNHGFVPCLEDCEIYHMEAGEVQAILEWFELVLKQKRLPDPRYRTYVIGDDRWMKQDCWPQKLRRMKFLYFDGMATEGYNGKLCPAAGLVPGKLQYQYDPDNPIISHGSESLLMNMKENGSLLQPEPGYRGDVLSFVSESLVEPMCICGKMKVYLYISSDCEDTAFTAKVMEVRSNGKAYNIRSSITTISHTIEQSYQPGSIVRVAVEMWDIVYALKPGSKIRIDISSSDFPQYHVHSNYTGIWSKQDKKRIANQSIYYGADYSSAIEIPYL